MRRIRLIQKLSVSSMTLMLTACGGSESPDATPLPTARADTSADVARPIDVTPKKPERVIHMTPPDQSPPEPKESSVTPVAKTSTELAPPTEAPLVAAPSRTVASFLSFTAPKPSTWISQPPQGTMRHVQFVVPGRDGADQAHIVVFYFGPDQGGSPEDNITRWTSQFQSPEGRPVTPLITNFDANEMPVTLVELEGEWKGMGAGWYTPNQLFLGAIVESPIGNLYIRFVGPAPTVEAGREDFLTLLTGLKYVDPTK